MRTVEGPSAPDAVAGWVYMKGGKEKTKEAPLLSSPFIYVSFTHITTIRR